MAINNLEFRDLRADEIDCRIASVKKNGVTLLLYKDARCDMNILDETVGAFNWQRSHSRDNANCSVSIWDDMKQQWITKEDTGTESNTEAAKGLASDSFKRACFNWGIGRELYTAPFIWVPSTACNISENKCYDKFKVQDIVILNKKITALTIYNDTTNAVVYQFNSEKKSRAKKTTQAPAEAPKASPEPATAPDNTDYRSALREFLSVHRIDPGVIVAACKLKPNSTNEDWRLALEYAKDLVKA